MKGVSFCITLLFGALSSDTGARSLLYAKETLLDCIQVVLALMKHEAIKKAGAYIAGKRQTEIHSKSVEYTIAVIILSSAL